VWNELFQFILQIIFGSLFNIYHSHSDLMLNHHRFRIFLVLFYGVLQLHLWELWASVESFSKFCPFRVSFPYWLALLETKARNSVLLRSTLLQNFVWLFDYLLALLQSFSFRNFRLEKRFEWRVYLVPHSLRPPNENRAATHMRNAHPGRPKNRSSRAGLPI